MKRQRGFTLIELLVVIAIIAILAAILFPVFIAAKDKGMQAVCIGNQRQLGTAVMQYVRDWHDTFPFYRASIAYSNYSPGVSWPPYKTHRYGAFYPLANYLRNVKVLMCPSASPNAGDKVPHAPYISNINVNGYGPSALWGVEYFNNYVPNYGAKVSEIVLPTRVVCTAEWNFQWWGRPDPGFNHYMVPGLHNGGMNITFADGHARWYSVQGMPTDLHPNNGPSFCGEPEDWPEKGISYRKDYHGSTPTH